VNDGPVQRWVPGEPMPEAIVAAIADPDYLFVADHMRALGPLLRFASGKTFWCPVTNGRTFRRSNAGAARRL
jgi:hypothetical protein